MEMVVVATVGSRFEAEVLAAKLGAHGLLWEIRSRQLLPPIAYPFGALDVMVPAEEKADAEAVLAPDELPVIDDEGRTVDVRDVGHTPLSPTLRALRVALGLALLVPAVVALALWAADALKFFDVVR
ncbi:MAG: hypothetical protein ACOYOP_04425 [Microthrixaceae bacterium]